jgi:hypothetical protein
VFCGRVVGDPAWLDTDRGYALAWTSDKRATCTGCGTRADEWDDDEDAYIGDQVHCPGCAVLAQEQANIPRDGDGQPRPGRHVFLAPRELYEARHADGVYADEHAPPAPDLDDD